MAGLSISKSCDPDVHISKLSDDAGFCFYLHAAARKDCDGFLDIVHIEIDARFGFICAVVRKNYVRLLKLIF
jgi:hypothetical protein